MTDERLLRRPIAARGTRWAAAIAGRLARWGVAPNAISAASVLFAAGTAAAAIASREQSGTLRALLLVAGALAIPLRLLANLFDGMVAIEGGQGAKDGPFWNEAPDRGSDLLFFAGAGLAAGNPELGLLAAALAIATAYIRELGRAENFPPDFSGPLAKPQRMAVLTGGTVFAALYATHWTLTVTLWIIVAGTAATVIRRSWTLIEKLKSR